MKILNTKKFEHKIVFCTYTDIKSRSSGDAINDFKLYESIPDTFNKTIIYPCYKFNGNINLNVVKSFIRFFKHFIKEIITSNKYFITRGSKLAVFTLIFKRLFKNKIIVRMGCTPLMFVERMAFLENPEISFKKKLIYKILIPFEKLIEKYVLRKSDKFIVENEKAKNMILFYGSIS